MSIKKPLIATLLSAIFGFSLFGTARQIEDGIRHEYSGRRSGAKEAMAAVAEGLGTKGCLIVWIAATGISGLWLGIAIKRKNKE